MSTSVDLNNGNMHGGCGVDGCYCGGPQEFRMEIVESYGDDTYNSLGSRQREPRQRNIQSSMCGNSINAGDVSEIDGDVSGSNKKSFPVRAVKYFKRTFSKLHDGVLDVFCLVFGQQGRKGNTARAQEADEIISAATQQSYTHIAFENLTAAEINLPDAETKVLQRNADSEKNANITVTTAAPAFE